MPVSLPTDRRTTHGRTDARSRRPRVRLDVTQLEDRRAAGSLLDGLLLTALATD